MEENVNWNPTLTSGSVKDIDDGTTWRKGQYLRDFVCLGSLGGESSKDKETLAFACAAVGGGGGRQNIWEATLGSPGTCVVRTQALTQDEGGLEWGERELCGVFS